MTEYDRWLKKRSWRKGKCSQVDFGLHCWNQQQSVLVRNSLNQTIRFYKVCHCWVQTFFAFTKNKAIESSILVMVKKISVHEALAWMTKSHGKGKRYWAKIKEQIASYRHFHLVSRLATVSRDSGPWDDLEAAPYRNLEGEWTNQTRQANELGRCSRLMQEARPKAKEVEWGMKATCGVDLYRDHPVRPLKEEPLKARLYDKATAWTTLPVHRVVQKHPKGSARVLRSKASHLSSFLPLSYS